ncbi:MAG: DoxX family protein [Cyanobacteria bacterium HKST-UBA02]|nr:DoxX family protein [Cyanobacteria bacterium HKST-UBA02]
MDNPVVKLAEKLYGLLVKAGDLFVAQILLLVFRLHWGLEFIGTGMGKLEHHDKTVAFFTSIGVPLPELNAWFVGCGELAGGVLLILGFAGRPVGAFLTVMMTVAYLSVADDRAKVLNMFSDPGPFLSADPFFFLLTALIVLAFGPGKLSADYLIGKYVFKKEQSAS